MVIYEMKKITSLKLMLILFVISIPFYFLFFYAFEKITNEIVDLYNVIYMAIPLSVINSVVFVGVKNIYNYYYQKSKKNKINF